jgi:ferritin
MLSKKLQDALNDQITNELYSAYVYLAMSAHLTGANLPGFARWMRLQSQEEYSHAMKIYDFVLQRGGRVVLKPIDQPPAQYKSPLDVFQQALKHEQKVTGLINRLYELAIKENDYPTQIMLQWFITEQVEEEHAAGDVEEQLKMIGNEPTALFLLDQQLGARGAES